VSDKGGQPSQPQILPPDPDNSGDFGGLDPADFNNLTLAQISNYTDRPDLLIDAIENHDPGFVQRMNAESEEFAKKQRDSMFGFGKFQAYSGSFLAIIAALVTLGLIAWTVVAESFSWTLGVFFIVFYAVTQGGSSGFATVIDSVKSLFGRGGGGPSSP